MRRIVLLLVGGTLLGGMLQASDPVELKIRLTAPLNTTLSRKGDIVAAKILEPEAYRGGYLAGDVIDIRGGAGKRALIEFQFNTLHLEGKAIPILASVTRISNSKDQVAVDEDGAMIEEEGGSGSSGKLSQISGVFSHLTKKGEKQAPSSGVTRLGSKASKLSLAVGSQCTVQINTQAKTGQSK